MENLFTQISPSSSPAKTVKRACKDCGKEFETPYQAAALLGKTIDLTRTRCPSCHAILLKQREQEVEAEQRKKITQQQESWRAKCGIPYRFRDKTFENFEAGRQPQAYKRSLDYAAGYLYGDTHPMKSIYLYSVKPEIGVGKTHLSCAIGNRIISQWDGDGSAVLPFFYTSEREFLLRIRASYNHRNNYTEHHETEDEIYRQLINTPLLILDDIGKYEGGKHQGDEISSVFVRDAYWQVIDGRYQEQLPAVITSNFSALNIVDYLGQPSAERLIEMTWQNVVRLKGKSYRIPLDAPEGRAN